MVRARRMTATLSEVDLYRRLHAGNPGDVDFYLHVAQHGRSVLELGSGWGRISIPLAHAGHQVVGVENNAELLALARECSGLGTSMLRFVEGDMRDLDLGRTFDTIIIPYNALYCLGGRDGVRACFQSVRRHMTDDTRVWFDVYPIDAFHRLAARGELPPAEPELIDEWGTPPKAIAVYETTEVDPARQRLRVHYDARDAEGRTLGQQVLIHDYLLTTQIHEDLRGAGMEALTVLGDYIPDSADDDLTGHPWAPAASDEEDEQDEYCIFAAHAVGKGDAI